MQVEESSTGLRVDRFFFQHVLDRSSTVFFFLRAWMSHGSFVVESSLPRNFWFVKLGSLMLDYYGRQGLVCWWKKIQHDLQIPKLLQVWWACITFEWRCWPKVFQKIRLGCWPNGQKRSNLQVWRFWKLEKMLCFVWRLENLWNRVFSHISCFLGF